MSNSSSPEEKYKDHEFGLIALNKGYITESQLDECIEIQRQSPENFRLGQILVKNHYITVNQFLELLSYQEKRILLCSKCGAKYNVAKFTPGKKIRCSRCKQVLVVPKQLDTIGVQGTTAATVSFNPDSTPSPEDSAEEAEEIQQIGDYIILKEIARGGMGIVYQARQVSLNRIVALKVLISGEYSSEEQIKRFKREAESAGSLNHPNIVSILDVGQVEEQYYISMEYIDGRDLNEFCTGNLDLNKDQILGILIEISEALHFAHKKGLIHRDVKPANVLLDKDNHPHLTDFGLAKFIDRNQSLLTQGDSALGTPLYMAPEQARGEARKVDARTDIYALGVMAYQLLAKRLPFHAKNSAELYEKICDEIPPPLRSIDPEISPMIERVVSKALEKEKEKRFQSALAMADEFRRILENKPIRTKAPSPWVRRIQILKSNRKPLLLAFFFVLLAFIGGGVFWKIFFGKENKNQTVKENNKKRVTFLIKQAKLLEKKEYQKAIELLNEACLLAPESYEALITRIQFYLYGELYSTAEEELTKLEKSKEPSFYFLRGQLYLKTQRINEAKKDFEQCLLLDKQYRQLDAYFYLAKLRFQLKKQYPKIIEELTLYLEKGGKKQVEAFLLRGKSRSFLDEKDPLAVEDLTQAVALDPNSVELLIEQGRLYLLLEEADAALSAFNKGLEKEPENAFLYCLRAQGYLQKKMVSKALEDFESSLSFNASFVPTYLAKAQYYMDSLAVNKAEKELLKAFSFAKENPDISVFLARVYLINRRFKSAKKRLDFLLKDPKTTTAEVLILNGQLSFKKKEYTKAAEYFSRALALSATKKENFQVQLGLARVYLEQKNYKAALEKTEKCLKIDATLYPVYLSRGKIFRLLSLKKGSNQKQMKLLAEDAFNQANKLMTTAYVDVYQDLKKYLDTNRHYRAIPILNRLLKIDPYFALGYYLRGRSYLAEKSYEDAMKDFARTLNLLPNHFDARLSRAMIYGQQKQFKKARDEYHGMRNVDGSLFVKSLLECAEMHLVIGDKEHAKKDANFVLKSHPTQRKAQQLLKKSQE